MAQLTAFAAGLHSILPSWLTGQQPSELPCPLALLIAGQRAGFAVHATEGAARSDEEEEAALAEAIRRSLAELHLTESTNGFAVGAPSAPEAPPEPEQEPGRGLGTFDRPSAPYSWTPPVRGSGVRGKGAAASSSRGSGLQEEPGPAPRQPPRGSEQPPAASAFTGSGPEAASSGDTAAPPGAAPRRLSTAELAALPASERLRLERGRAYAVWSAPLSRSPVIGVHIGPHCWHSVEECLCGGRYLTGRDRLRGAWGLAAALELYESERRRWRAPSSPTIYIW